MKKTLLILSAIFIFFAGCRKDKDIIPLKVNSEVTELACNSAVIEGSYEYAMDIEEFEILYSDKEDMSGAKSAAVKPEGQYFKVKLTDLEAGKNYYYSFYFKGDHNTEKTEAMSFRTKAPVLPVVVTKSITDITQTTASCGGDVTSDGGGTVTARGVCWSTKQNPTINDNKTTDGNGIGSYNSNLSNLSDNTKYYVRAYATNEAGTAYGEEKSFTTLEEEKQEEPSGFENGYAYIDLGLPSGLKWATSNVGAESQSASGDYYAWGETETKEEYTEANYSLNGIQMSDISGDPQYDVARKKWGSTWRIPTKAEQQELIDECEWEWKGNGYIVTGPNGNSIFLPAAGFRIGSSLNDAGSAGYYWSSTPYENNTNHAYYLSFYSGNQGMVSYYRVYGQSVRPVFGNDKEEPEIKTPAVTTNSVTSITSESAVCGGNVTSDGNGTVTARGVCWSTKQNPTINDNKTTDGNGIGSYNSNLSNLSDNTTYYVRAYATNEKGTSYGLQKSFTTLEEDPYEETISGEENGHAYVDLGLPSGLKWATCNVGASSSKDYGNYYAWGEITTKTQYTEENSLTWGLDISELQSQGYIDGDGNLTSSHDAATANWGGDWRMPTEEERRELVDNCTWTWITHNGVDGCKVTGPNGNSIFLPAAGCLSGLSLYNAGSHGYYWSSTPYESDAYYAYDLYFYSSSQSMDYGSSRLNGLSVRPVFGNDAITTPTVTTSSITYITSSSASCGGNITSDGNGTVTARGVCWSTSPNPTIYDNKTNNGSGIGSYNSNLSNLSDNTTYYVRAYATNEAGTAYGEEKIFTTLEEEPDDPEIPEDPTTGTLNGHAWVDLGLPSGLKWATCNVGANEPEEYGDYYAWGETETKEEYTEENCSTYGVQMSDISGNDQYDVARKQWGSTWRMPTEEEQQELLDNCEWQWTTQSGVNGYKVTGPNGNHIFLPFAGYRRGSSLINAGEYGSCWSSSPNESHTDYAYYLRFDSSYLKVYSDRRYIGHGVRPVTE